MGRFLNKGNQKFAEFHGHRRKYMNLLKYGDTIGIISPSWVANQNDYERYAKGIERLGCY